MAIDQVLEKLENYLDSNEAQERLERYANTFAENTKSIEELRALDPKLRNLRMTI
ncbi:hypothetical protein J7J84_05480 [bacterium]|nr:hypothetical protein [bacterium]